MGWENSYCFKSQQVEKQILLVFELDPWEFWLYNIQLWVQEQFSWKVLLRGEKVLNAFIFCKNGSADVQSVVFLEDYSDFMASFNWSSSWGVEIFKEEMPVVFQPQLQSSRAVPSETASGYLGLAEYLQYQCGSHQLFTLNFHCLISFIPSPCPAGKGCFGISVQKRFLKAEWSLGHLCCIEV